MTLPPPVILLVEDDLNLRLALRDNLENQGGYGLEEAPTVAEARAHLARRTFQLILLDVMLTDGDGYTLCRTLRQEGVTTPVLMDAVWGRDVVVDPHTVDNFVSSLKRKLGWNSASRFAIQTVRGVGYRMEIEGT
jgi:DNA-binding response OmpR family regulator